MTASAFGFHPQDIRIRIIFTEIKNSKFIDVQRINNKFTGVSPKIDLTL